MNVVVDGLMTNYQKGGTGKKIIICLPGWADTANSFSKLVEALQADFTIYVLDLPGFGATQAPASAWGLEDYAQFVSSWAKKIKISPTAVIGHSYGGSVAITGLGKKILKPKKLILLASAGVRHKKMFRKRVLKVVTKTGKVPLKLLPESSQRRLRQKFYQSLGSDITLLPHMELTFKRIIDDDVREVAKSIKVPTLLIYGDKDQDTPVGDGRHLRDAIAGSKMEVIKHAGHFLHQTDTTVVSHLIKNFLEDRRG